MNMIEFILRHNFTIKHFPLFTKYINETFDIIAQNNRNIIVVNKKLNIYYKDLKTAYTNICKN